MNPNSVLAAWQLAVMAVVPVAALAIWLTAIFLAAREPRGRAQAAAASPTGVTAPETGAEWLPTLVPAIRAIGSCRFQALAAGLRATRLEDVISMRALVVYESMYGSTQVIAGNIADGLRGDYEVTLVPVAEATAELVAGADLLVAGAPTHMHGLPSASSRRMATQAAAKEGSGLRMVPGAGGPGMGNWLRDLGCRDGLAAAFDTRLNGVPVFTGRASRSIARLLKRHGRRLVAASESFMVGSQNTLLDGEIARARRWGMTLGAVSKTYLPAPA